MAVKTKEPLLHIAKRDNVTPIKSLAIRALSVIGGILLMSIICSLISGKGIEVVIDALYNGAFGTERKTWITLRDTAILLIVALALIPAFKMKFWNLGGNGQIFVACIACVACMKFLNGVVDETLTIVIMLVSSVLIASLWGVIPAIFKAKFGTNESLFTLMLNYIAQFLVAFFVMDWSDSGSNTIKPMKFGRLPEIGGKDFAGSKYLLIILVAVALVVFMTLYLKKSKQGYELTVVGESQNTARYVGINVKKVVIRTMALSGAICGIAGFLLVGAVQYTMSETITNNMGFTAIIATWLGKCNPLTVVLTCFLIQFLSRGMVDVKSKLKFTDNSIADISVAIVYFVIIGAEFFITYAIKSPKIRAVVDKVWLPVKGFLTKIFAPVGAFLKKIFAPVVALVKTAYNNVKGWLASLVCKIKPNSKNTEEGGNK